MTAVEDIRRENLNKLVFESGLSDAKFSERLTSVSPSYLSQLKANPTKTGSRNIGEKTARKIEQDLELDPYDLDREDLFHPAGMLSERKDHKWVRNRGRGMLSRATNRDADTVNTDYVPLISWSQAIDWAEVKHNDRLGDSSENVPCSIPHSLRTYALKVEGDSMTSGGTKSFPPGIKIIVDLDEEPANGDFVIAKIEGEDGVTFKQFVQDGARTYLKPLNPQYPTIADDFRVFGKIIQAIIDL